jgi:cell division protein FtsB
MIDRLLEFGSDVRERAYRTRYTIFAVAAIALALLLVLQILSGRNGWLEYRRKKSDYQDLQKQIETLQKEKQDLTSRTKALRERDPKAIEKEAREQLRYAKPGEVIVVVPQAHQTQRDIQSAEKK